MWRLLSPAILPLLLAAAAYLASPLVAAHMLQRAIVAGDVGAIESKVDWPRLRASIKRSLSARLAEAAAARPEKPGVFQRISYRVQDAVAPGMIDRMVEREATPEGFVRYFRKGKDGPAEKGLLIRGPRAAAGGVIAAEGEPRASGMLGQIGAAHFLSPTRFSFEVADRHDPARRYLVELELGEDFWVLSRVEVLSLGSIAGR
jgi:hypothetical protein